VKRRYATKGQRAMVAAQACFEVQGKQREVAKATDTSAVASARPSLSCPMRATCSMRAGPGRPLDDACAAEGRKTLATQSYLANGEMDIGSRSSLQERGRVKAL
jgi:hypothetical protein